MNKTNPILALVVPLLCASAGSSGCVPDAETIELQAPVVEQHGRWTDESSCHVLIEPASRWGLNCRVVVECGRTALWGGSRQGGYANCDVEDRRLTRGHNGESMWRMWMRFDEEKLTLSRMGRAEDKLVVSLTGSSE